MEESIPGKSNKMALHKTPMEHQCVWTKKNEGDCGAETAGATQISLESPSSHHIKDYEFQ